MEEKAPLILQVSGCPPAPASTPKHVYLMKLIEAAIEDAEQSAGFDLPIAVHLDHGDSFELCQELHRRRFLLRLDRRQPPVAEENIKLTRRSSSSARTITAWSSKASWAVWAGIEDKVNVSAEDASYTRPEEVEEFVQQDRRRFLAIAIGNFPRRLQVPPPPSAPAARRASSCPRRCASTSWRKFPSVCPASRSCCGSSSDAAGVCEDDQRQWRQDAWIKSAS